MLVLSRCSVATLSAGRHPATGTVESDYTEGTAVSKGPGARRAKRADLSANKKSREASFARLQEIAEKYSRMIHASPDAITLRTLPERRYLEINEGFTRLTGYTAEDAIGKTSSELGLWVESEGREATLRTLEREGQIYEDEFQFRTKSGEVRWGQLAAVRFVLNRKPLMLSITHDITNLKRVEAALRQSEADQRSLVEEAPYGIYRVTLEGRLLQVNPALVRMLGYESQAALLAKDQDIYADPNRRDQLLREFWQRENFREAEAEWKKKDGHVITVRLTGRPVSKANTKIAYFEVFVEDITERRRLERQILQSQKMDAIGRLAGGVAHDFNNLLGVILGHSEILGERIAQQSQLRKSAEAIRSAAERAAALTAQLLAFSRKQLVEPKIIEVNAALQEMAKLVRRVLSEDIELILRLRADAGRVKIDPGQFDQVVMNLVVNARDAMPNGGKLILETAKLELDETYVRQHLGARPGTYLMLTVSDTGCGMDDATLSHIFEPFFTTKEQGKGTGLGLSTVYGIVKQAGAYIMPYSEPGEGTTMKIYFPAAEQEASIAQPARFKEDIPGGCEVILLVEDEPALRELARTILEEAGYQVIEAGEAEEALNIGMTSTTKIDLLLSDVVMPGMSGSELAKRLTSVRSDIKVVFVSGYSDDIVAHHGALIEGTSLLQKPFTKRNLLAKVRESLDAEHAVPSKSKPKA
jgi:two-component system cell cycle sensor histidine kinase/response regulator CckA